MNKMPIFMQRPVSRQAPLYPPKITPNKKNGVRECQILENVNKKLMAQSVI